MLLFICDLHISYGKQHWFTKWRSSVLPVWYRPSFCISFIWTRVSVININVSPHWGCRNGVITALSEHNLYNVRIKFCAYLLAFFPLHTQNGPLTVYIFHVQKGLCHVSDVSRWPVITEVLLRFQFWICGGQNDVRMGLSSRTCGCPPSASIITQLLYTLSSSIIYAT